MRTGLVFLTVVVMTFCGCSASPDSLKASLADLPGVVKVQVEQVEGDDDIPFQRIPNTVTIVMAADASEEEISAVFDELDDDVDSGGVDLILLSIAGEHAALSVGEGIHADHALVADLLEASRNPRIKSYKREAHPVLPGVDIELVSGGFDEVRALVTHYRDLPGIEFVQVVRGPFLYIHDEENDDIARTDARAELVSRVDSKFQLTGCVVSGRGPLGLHVDRADNASLKAFLSQDPAAQAVGSVEVR